MFQLIAGILGAIAFAGAVAWGWSEFKDWIGEPYAAEQRLADQPMVDKANAAQRKAEAEALAMTGERDRAKQDTQQCVDAGKLQTNEVNKWKAEAQRQANLAREAKAAADRRATEAAPRIAQLQADAAAKPQLMVCEVELGKARTVMQDALRARRGLPAAALTAPPAVSK